MLILKNQTVIDCLQSSDTKTRDDEKMTSFPKRRTLHFHFLGEYSKLNRVKTMGILVEKLKPFDEILNLQKMVDNVAMNC